MSPDFTCLYFLENETHAILDIKRLDLGENLNLTEACFWLIFDKQKLTIQKLSLRSVDADGEVQERFFDQGYLKFNSQNGTFIEKFNSGQHQLENKTGHPLPAEIKEVLTSYLTA